MSIEVINKPRTYPEEERAKLDHKSALVVMMWKLDVESLLANRGLYRNAMGGVEHERIHWKPTRNELQFRMVKDRLTELGLSFEEIARNEHVPANLVFRVYRGCSENVKSNFMEAHRGWTIQELGVACAIEAVERTKKATKE